MMAFEFIKSLIDFFHSLMLFLYAQVQGPPMRNETGKKVGKDQYMTNKYTMHYWL